MRIISIVLICVVCPSTITSEAIASYTDILTKHCSPPFHFYKSWCYYLFPNLTLDWSSAYRLCRSIDKHTSLVYVTGDDEMLDPLRDILIDREKSANIQSVWTNTTWGQQRRTLLSRQSKRLCRKIEVKSTLKSGQIDRLRMPFANCREKHSVMCRKELPSNLICRRPWALAYGICYYLDEQARITPVKRKNAIFFNVKRGKVNYSRVRKKRGLFSHHSYPIHFVAFDPKVFCRKTSVVFPILLRMSSKIAVRWSPAMSISAPPWLIWGNSTALIDVQRSIPTHSVGKGITAVVSLRGLPTMAFAFTILRDYRWTWPVHRLSAPGTGVICSISTTKKNYFVWHTICSFSHRSFHRALSQVCG